MKHLQPLAAHLPPDDPRRATPFPYPQVPPDAELPLKHPLMALADTLEKRYVQADNFIIFEEILRRTYLDVARELKTPWPQDELDAKAVAYSTSFGDFPAFPDSVAALRSLGTHGAGLKLIALSNVSNVGIHKVMNGPLKGIDFDVLYTAEQIGAYKPSAKNFDFLLDGISKECGVSKEDLVHVAHGIKSDQVPAEEKGIDHVWVARGNNCWAGTDASSMKRLTVVPDLQTLADMILKPT